MKKVLLTSTALVAFAGAAAAEVTLSGYAEMGIAGGEELDAQFFQDIDATLKMSGETDGGLAFGAAVDIDELQDASDPTDSVDNNFDDGGVAIFISGNFGTLTMGDTDGALDWAMQEANIGNPGSIADDETSHPGYFGAYHDGAGAYDGQIVRYDYSTGDFGFAISVEQATDSNGNADDVDIDPGFAIGAKYSTDIGGAKVGFGGGYQFVAEDALGAGAEEAAIFGVSASVVTGGLSAAIQITSGDVLGVEDSMHIGIGASYNVDAFTVHANYGMFDLDGTEISGYGLAAAYDLGGGASLHFGYGDGEVDGEDADGTYSFGLALSF